MAQIIGLPKLSPTMEEGVLVRWVKKEGDSVEPGDLIAEVETDKANMDFNLEDEGVLLKLLVAEGDTVKLGAPVAILGEEGEEIGDLEQQAKAMTGGDGAAPPPAAEGPTPKPAQAPTAPAEPAAAAPPEPGNQPATAPQPPGPRQPTPQQVDAGGGPRPAAVTGGGPGARLLASPLAKSLAIELGIDLRQLQGSGPGGRIVERDVREAAAGQAPQPSQVSAGAGYHPAAASIGQAAATGQASSVEAAAAAEHPGSTALQVFRGGAGVPSVLGPSDEYVDEPLSNMRKTIAARMTEAKRDVPHFYLTRDFDAARLLDFRKRLNDLLGDRGKVSVNDLMLKGVALALRRVPTCNAAFTGDAIRYFTRVHLGVAVATERGLITPVIRNADLKGIGVIGAEVRDLAERARDRRLKADEISGSTFTVSNLGMFGISHFQAIINPPEAAILALGTIREQPLVKDGNVVIGKMMSLTLSCDHRVIDGALGAKYLSELVDILEKPESLAL